MTYGEETDIFTITGEKKQITHYDVWEGVR